MKAISKILTTAIIVVEETRYVELITLTDKIDRLSSGINEYENLMFNAKTLEFQGNELEATAVRTVAQSKLEALAVDYKTAILESRLAMFGWAIRRPLITKNPRYERIRKYLGGE